MKGLLIAVGPPVRGKAPKVNPPGWKPEPKEPEETQEEPEVQERIGKEEAGFRDQNAEQFCANCEYFQDMHCEKGLEIDYTESDPAQSFCRLWESAGDEHESQAEEMAEGQRGEPHGKPGGVTAVIGIKPKR